MTIIFDFINKHATLNFRFLNKRPQYLFNHLWYVRWPTTATEKEKVTAKEKATRNVTPKVTAKEKATPNVTPIVTAKEKPRYGKCYAKKSRQKKRKIVACTCLYLCAMMLVSINN